MSDTLLAILHMCVFPGGAFALLVAMQVWRGVQTFYVVH